MTINNHFTERRNKDRRTVESRRLAVRFGDVMGRRNGRDRRVSVRVFPA